MKNRMMSILIVLIVLLSGAVSASGEDRPKPSWTWTEENPKPAWFTWGKEYWPEEPVRGGYIKMAAARYIGLMNPNLWPVNDWGQMTMMYDMMINNIGDYRAKAYMLAESLEYTSPTTVVMKLRKGVQFHDGTDFNAESLKYQLEWIKDRRNGAWSRAWLEPLESVDIIDEYTVQFNTKEIWAGLPGVCTGAPFYAISREALKKDSALKEVQRLERAVARAQKSGQQDKLVKLEKELATLKEYTAGAVPLDTHAVGAGKYMLEEASPGNFLKLKRNPNWWFGQSIGKPEMPYPDGVIFTVIPDNFSAFGQPESGTD